MNLVSELIIAKNGLVSASSEEGSESINQSFNEQIEYLERVTTNLHESVHEGTYDAYRERSK